MADTTIRGLAGGDSGQPAADAWFIAQATSGATTPLAHSFASIGGLEQASNTLTTANLTASVGTLHKLTIAGLTAVRDFILPDTAAVGQRVGLYVVDGDPDFEVAIKTAATGSLLNGTDHSATLYTSVFIKNEVMVFECINGGGAGDTDWIVVNDGRIPCFSKMSLSSTTTGSPMTASTYVTLPTQNTDFDTGDIADLTNDRFNIRRAGTYEGVVSMQVSSPTAGLLYLCRAVSTASGTPVELSAGPKHTIDNAADDIFVNQYKIKVAAASIGTAAGQISGQGYCLTNSKDLIGTVSRTYHLIQEVF